MFEFLAVVVFVWLGWKALGLMLRLTWSAAKLVAGLLLGLALPALIVCGLLVGGIALLVPIAMVCAAVGIIKACV